jgi:hypothetical protein
MMDLRRTKIAICRILGIDENTATAVRISFEVDGPINVSIDGSLLEGRDIDVTTISDEKPKGLFHLEPKVDG